MKSFKIAFLETEKWEEDYLKSKLSSFNPIFFENNLNHEILKKIYNFEIVSPFIYSVFDKKTINYFKNLKFIATRSTGFDHINIKECKKKNILVSNVPSYGSNTVAEHTFALLLALVKKIHLSVEKTKKGDFSLDNLQTIDLKEKTIGIIGTGNIGQEVARIAKGFKMNILAYDVKPDIKFAKKMGVRYTTFKNLLKNSDIITLHVPYNKKTHHLISIKSLKFFKKGCYLINTSRGGVCDTTALLQGLKSKIFAGLGLDVLEEERFIKEERQLISMPFKKTCDVKTVLENHILINRPEVIVTPHNAFNSKEALIEILETTYKNIISFIKGKPINLIKD
jgi:D-lactate dehydrogenase